MTTFARASAVMTGISYFLFWWAYFLLLPFDQLMTNYPAIIGHRLWIPVNLLQVLGHLAYVLFFFEYAARRYSNSPLDRVFLVFQIIGLTTFGAVAFFETFLWPVIALSAPHLLLLAASPIYTSWLFLAPVIVGLLSFLAGNIYLGTKLMTVHRGFAIIYMVGVTAFTLGNLSGPLRYAVQSVGITALAIGLVGLAMIRPTRPKPEVV